MKLGLVLTIIAFPLIELALLIRVGQSIGVFATLAIVIGTAILGLLILRWQGFSVVQRTTRAIQEGRPPGQTVLDSAGVYLAGALLMSPGLIADTIGLLLLIPWVRTVLARWFVRQFAEHGSARVRIFRTRQEPPRGAGPAKPPQSDGGQIIEGDYKRIDEPRD